MLHGIISQSKLAHEPDGLIFQPAGKEQAYKGGRDDEVALFLFVLRNAS